MLFLHSGKHFFVNDSLYQLEEELDPKHFFRVNRQLIVALKSIVRISPFGLQKLKIDLVPEYEKPVMISKLKVTAFKNWLDS
jgi:DNA-binding LytR/AlgR family response regulator